MKYVLSSNSVGYYSRAQPIFGRNGDFVTSPEISHLFGEIVGCWIGSKLKPSERYILLELGPGLGTLMKDILSTLRSLNLLDRIDRVELLECSDHFKSIQKNEITSIGKNVLHIDDIQTEHYSGKNVVILAHEFFDALPAHLFRRMDSGRWAEVLVDFENEFIMTCSAGSTLATKILRVDDMFPNQYDYIELSPECWSFAKKLSMLGRAAKHVSGLIIDYGNWGPSNGSLRAIWKHTILESPLDKLGEADLSVDVDFRALSHYLKRIYECRYMTQKDFLESCHIDRRLQMLLDPDLKFKSQRDRLMIDMGSVYKVISLEKSNSPPN